MNMSFIFSVVFVWFDYELFLRYGLSWCFLWTGAWDLDVEEKSELAEMTEESEESEKTEWNRNTGLTKTTKEEVDDKDHKGTMSEIEMRKEHQWWCISRAKQESGESHLWPGHWSFCYLSREDWSWCGHWSRVRLRMGSEVQELSTLYTNPKVWCDMWL